MLRLLANHNKQFCKNMFYFFVFKSIQQIIEDIQPYNTRSLLFTLKYAHVVCRCLKTKNNLKKT